MRKTWAEVVLGGCNGRLVALAAFLPGTSSQWLPKVYRWWGRPSLLPSEYPPLRVDKYGVWGFLSGGAW